MARLEDAVRAVGEDVALDLEVQPGARSDGFPVGFSPWRRRIQARVGAPPEDGAANEALLGLVASFFGVPRGRVQLTSGATSRLKTVVVLGLAGDEALARLRVELKALR